MRSLSIVGRVAGLCALLLPIPYVLCVMGHNIRCRMDEVSAEKHISYLLIARCIQFIHYNETAHSRTKRSCARELKQLCSVWPFYYTSVVFFLHLGQWSEGNAKAYANNIILQMLSYLLCRDWFSCKVVDTVFPLLMDSRCLEGIDLSDCPHSSAWRNCGSS